MFDVKYKLYHNLNYSSNYVIVNVNNISLNEVSTNLIIVLKYYYYDYLIMYFLIIFY